MAKDIPVTLRQVQGPAPQTAQLQALCAALLARLDTENSD